MLQRPEHRRFHQGRAVVQLALVAARPVEGAEEQPPGVQASQDHADEQADPDEAAERIVALASVRREIPRISAAFC